MIRPFKTKESLKSWQQSNCQRCRFAHLANGHQSMDTKIEQVEAGKECQLKMILETAAEVAGNIDMDTARSVGYTAVYGFATRCKVQRPRDKHQGLAGKLMSQTARPKASTPSNQLDLFT